MGNEFGGPQFSSRATYPTTFKLIDAYLGEVLEPAVWSVGASTRIRLLGGRIMGTIITAMANALPGSQIVLYDAAIGANKIIAPLFWIGGATQGADAGLSVTSVGTEVGGGYAPSIAEFHYPYPGITLAAGNDILASVVNRSDGSTIAVDDIDTGEIWLTGVLWGQELT
jgi:hypothetical protein